MITSLEPLQTIDHPSRIRHNNFDLIRLFAALQVAISHAIIHLSVSALEPLRSFLAYVPGVPIFFVISGYLISMSWYRAPSVRQYFWNRLLRIYPALWVCLIISIVIVTGSGVYPGSFVEFTAWIAAQVTLFQFYNPDFLRGYGVGVINGSLWTIPVELQFYIILPLLAASAKRIRSLWYLYAAVSVIMMILARNYAFERDTIPQKLINVSIIPYLFYFLVGVILRTIYEKTPRLFEGQGILWAGVYLAWAFVETWLGFSGTVGNRLNILSIVLLGMAVVSVASSGRRASWFILRENDISYGIYIYHMPIINFLVFQRTFGPKGFFWALTAVLIAAIISWKLVEKPALRLKKYSLRS